jgi:hypothetical protein
MIRDLDADEYGQAEADAAALQHRAIGFDIALALEPLHAAQAWRRRQPDAAGELDIGQPPVRLERRDDAAVDRVKREIWHTCPFVGPIGA